MVKEWTLKDFYLMVAGTLATEGSFSLKLRHETDTETGYDNIQVIAACCEYLSQMGYLQWFLKEIDGWYYLACQADDVWNVRKEQP